MCIVCVIVCVREWENQEGPDGGVRYCGAGTTIGHQSLDLGAKN